jgi:hypothetical protein
MFKLYFPWCSVLLFNRKFCFPDFRQSWLWQFSLVSSSFLWQDGPRQVLYRSGCPLGSEWVTHIPQVNKNKNSLQWCHKHPRAERRQLVKFNTKLLPGSQTKKWNPGGRLWWGRWFWSFCLGRIREALSEEVSFEMEPEWGIVAHTYNLSTGEAEAGESRLWDQPGLHSETLPQKTKK